MTVYTKEFGLEFQYLYNLRFITEQKFPPAPPDWPQIIFFKMYN